MTSSLTIWKSIAIASNLIVCLVGIALSHFLGQSSWFRVGCAAASGVVLATALTHLLPEASEHMKDWEADNLDGYPLAFLLAGVAFLFLLILEEGVSWLQTRSKAGIKTPDCVDESDENDETSCHSHTAFLKMSETSAFFVFIALTVHSVLEGLAVGATAEVAGLVWTLVAILAHKGLAAFALGAMMVEASVPRLRFVLYSVIFSIMTPIGILIGWLSSATEDDAGLFGSVCNALAAGTFIFVSTWEFLPLTFRACKERFPFKILALLLGFALMSILPIWAHVHSHDHGDDHHHDHEH